MRTQQRFLATAAAALLCQQLLATVAPAPASGRVEPLSRITRQIHKPNMLILLDTSGSLVGVPGGSFDTSDEVGVDCDGGVDCRGGLSEGTCRDSPKACTTDVQCRTGTCQTGLLPCNVTADCIPIPGVCSTGQNCFVDGDCPPRTSGNCAYIGDTCSPSNPCDGRMRCRHGSNVSCSTNSDCRPGVCAGSSTTCNTSDDCPYYTTGGTCTWPTTPVTACAPAACPTRPMACSNDSSRLCSTRNDCAMNCKKAGNVCTTNGNCTAMSGDKCELSANCASPTNTCNFSRTACNLLYTDNICQETNACIPSANTCTGASTNLCQAGMPGDVCNASGAITGSNMCRIGQSKCTMNGDCHVATDTCGPATSRTVMAKRVIRNIVSANANILNLGLMTFYQANYFPYYTVSGSTTSTTRATNFKEGTLRGRGCYSTKTGLTSSCTIDGKTYTLRASNNAQYVIQGKGNRDDSYVDRTYCGQFCNIPGRGTGIFRGAYYEYTDVVGTLSAQVDFPTYRGKVFSESGVTYRYYDSRPDYYNGGGAPPISTPSCGASCSASCGGRWDTQLAPFITADDSQTSVDAVISAFNQAMEPASQGGLITYAGTPSGCALENDVSPDRNHSAYHYMQAAKAADTLTCRLNYVLFITDGEANGPGDSGCTNVACAATNPVAAGCTCRAVLAAYRMRLNLGVKTIVVGFSTDASAGAGRTINDNIARAGGTDAGGDSVAPYAFGAASEKDLNIAIQDAIYQAVLGSYSTAPATASQGTIQGSTRQSGNILLDSRVDFPSWKGHLVAYDVSGESPVLSWDAATRLASRDWRTRRVYTSNSSNALVQIEVDQSTGEILNKGDLYTMGLGGTEDEAEEIARWMLGDPALKNPAVLGSIINSTPIDVGSVADGTAPGLHSFYVTHQSRPSVTYVGSDDGMLHAFYTRDVTVGATTYQGGSEAFAYLPPTMLSVVTRLFAQGGQVADPRQHIYGLASSPKVKSICVDNCNSGSALWKTLLVMTEGWGGNGVFMLDITNPMATLPFELMWSGSTRSESASYASDLGLTTSVPAFLFMPSTAMDDYRVMLTSGYPTTDGSTTQGRYLISASARDGTLTTQTVVVPGGTACTQDYTLLTDVGTSRKQSRETDGVANGRKEFLAGYFGDTWGNLWRFTAAAGAQKISAFGCQQPLHFAPTIVQLDADDPNNPRSGDVYVIQVTNSSLDAATEGFEASQMAILKETTNSSGVLAPDTAFGTGGKIVLTSASGQHLCGVTNAAGDVCLTPLPANARPLATPTAILKFDGTGFVTFSTWYAAATGGCGKGATYLLVHDLSGNNFLIKQAFKIADEPVVNPVIVKGTLMISTSAGPISIAGSVTTTIVSATDRLTNVGDPFQIGGWTELME